MRCLLIDFSKAFDVVDHGVRLLVAKLSCLPLPPSILNWLISFLSGRNHTTKTSAGESAPACINRSIIQGSGLGPTLYLILESDLEPKCRINQIFKYANDTNHLLPELTDVELCDEFLAIQNWAQINKMIINMVNLRPCLTASSAFCQSSSTTRPSTQSLHIMVVGPFLSRVRLPGIA